MIDHLSMISKHESDQRLHGLRGVGIYYPCSDWPLGGSKTVMESSASKDTPCQISGLFDFISPFLSPLSIFSCFLVFGSTVATASSSSSASPTTSSLASA